MINTTNELNAGYAADGYARVKGIGCVMVTFTVGGLSVINAVAGAYSESLPLIVITGGPNSNDYGTSRILHHTTGLPNFHQEAACFKEVTAAQVCSACHGLHWTDTIAFTSSLLKRLWLKQSAAAALCSAKATRLV